VFPQRKIKRLIISQLNRSICMNKKLDINRYTIIYAQKALYVGLMRESVILYIQEFHDGKL